MKIADIVVIAGVLILTGALAFHVYAGDNAPPVLRITSADHEWFYPLDKDREIEVTGPLGPTLIRISHGGVAVVDSPCHEKICVKSGVIEKNGSWIACLPNQVLLTIEGKPEGSYDAESY